MEDLENIKLALLESDLISPCEETVYQAMLKYIPIYFDNAKKYRFWQLTEGYKYDELEDDLIRKRNMTRHLVTKVILELIYKFPKILTSFEIDCVKSEEEGVDFQHKVDLAIFDRAVTYYYPVGPKFKNE